MTRPRGQRIRGENGDAPADGGAGRRGNGSFGLERGHQHRGARTGLFAGGALLGCWRVGHRPLRSTGRWGPGDMTLLLAAGVGKGSRAECVTACPMA